MNHRAVILNPDGSTLLTSREAVRMGIAPEISTEAGADDGVETIIKDLQERLDSLRSAQSANRRLAKVRKRQNAQAGYNAEAVRILECLARKPDATFQDIIRTLRPGLDRLIDARALADTSDLFEKKSQPPESPEHDNPELD